MESIKNTFSSLYPNSYNHLNHLMKFCSINNKLVITIVALLLVISTNSCVDEFIDSTSIGNEIADKGYFSIKVRVPYDGSRADDVVGGFENGTANEHAIDPNGEHILVYFDENYKYAGYQQMTFTRVEPIGSSENIEATFICRMSSDPADVRALPVHGMLVINAHNFMENVRTLHKGFSSMTELFELVDVTTEDHQAGRAGQYFTMTSSAYLINESGTWIHNVAFDLDKTQFWPTEDEAIANPIGIAYVERMLSKFTIDFQNGTTESGLTYIPNGESEVVLCTYSEDGAPYMQSAKWTSTVDRWAVSGMEPDSYIFKNIVSRNFLDELYPNADTEGYGYPYNFGSDINSINSPFYSGWNSASDYRSHWAIDFHYPYGYYPRQYRMAVDNIDIDYYDKGDRALNYLSYNEMISDLSGNGTTAGSEVVYTTENTFPANIDDSGITMTDPKNYSYLSTRSAKSRASSANFQDYAATFLIVSAQLHIEGVDEDMNDYDLYRDRTGVFYPSKTDFATYFITTFNSQLYSHRTMTYYYYDWENPLNNKNVVKNTVSLDEQDYVLYYNDAPMSSLRLDEVDSFTMAAQIEGGDGKIIPWIEGMYIARNNNGSIQRLNISDNDLKSIIYDWLGAFDHFNKGHMYYTAPIRHNITTANANNKNYEPQVGDYGVVRNHWYQLNVLGINSIGNPLDSYSQKIIPYVATLDNSLNVEIKVAPWHLFQTVVDLPKKPQ